MLVTIIVLSVILLDLLSKYLTIQLLVPLGREVVFIPKVLNFAYVENRGAAFGILADKRWVFMILSVALIIFLIVTVRKLKITHPLFVISVSFIIGGGIGNMIDRVFLGYVVDFIKTTFIDFPVFNIADSTVVVGTILLAIYIVFIDKDFLNKKAKGNKD